MQLENIMERLKIAKERLVIDRFKDMTPKQLVEYMTKNPDCEMVQNYLSYYVSRDFAEQVTIEAENLERDNYQQK